MSILYFISNAFCCILVFSALAKYKCNHLCNPHLSVILYYTCFIGYAVCSQVNMASFHVVSINCIVVYTVCSLTGVWRVKQLTAVSWLESSQLCGRCEVSLAYAGTIGLHRITPTN